MDIRKVVPYQRPSVSHQASNANSGLNSARQTTQQLSALNTLVANAPKSTQFLRGTQDLQNRINVYLSNVYGSKAASLARPALTSQDPSDRRITPQFKELIIQLLRKEIKRTYKIPYTAFGAFDTENKGYLEVDDFVNSKLAYRLPLTKDELRQFLEHETVFSKKSQLKLDLFMKNMFPEKQSRPERGASESSSDCSDHDVSVGVTGGSPFRETNKSASPSKIDGVSIGGTTSLTNSLKSHKMVNQIKTLDLAIKKRLQSNFTSVRKAFLELDETHSGYICAEGFARFMGGSKTANFDFTLLEILIKLKTKNKSDRVSYSDFCSWLGSTIEPTEAFYFRHDSKKNPQYEVSILKTQDKYAVNKKVVSDIITRTNMKEKFIHRTYNQFKTLKRGFVEWKTAGTNYIELGRFTELMEGWGFNSDQEDLIGELFAWLDVDKDGKVSFNDFKTSAGLELAPKEQMFFRQDVTSSKNVPCRYQSCFENTLFNNTSPYCALHQKVMKNSSQDLFTEISSKMPKQEWDLFAFEVIKQDYVLTLKALNALLINYTSKGLSRRQMEFIYETYKVKAAGSSQSELSSFEPRMAEEQLREQSVLLKDLINLRVNKKTKRLDDLIAIQNEADQAQEDYLLKGLEQVNEQFLAKLGAKNYVKWNMIWRSTKDYDNDQNGFLQIDELDACFREHFPYELTGKSVVHYFRKFGTNHDQNLVNYKKIRTELDKLKNEITVSQQTTPARSRGTTTPTNEKTIPSTYPDYGNVQKPASHLRSSRSILNIDKIAHTSRMITDADQTATKLPTLQRNQSSTLVGQQTVDEGRYSRNTLESSRGSSVLLGKQSSARKNIRGLKRDKSAMILGKNKDSRLILKPIGSTGETPGDNTVDQLPIKRSLLSSASLAKLDQTSTRGLNHRLGSTVSANLAQVMALRIAKNQKFIKEVNTKLGYEWKNIFRALVQNDVVGKGWVSVAKFNQACDSQNVHLTKEELRKLSEVSNSGNSEEIHYIQLSKQLGLHKSSYDQMKGNSLSANKQAVHEIIRSINGQKINLGTLSQRSYDPSQPDAFGNKIPNKVRQKKPLGVLQSVSHLPNSNKPIRSTLELCQVIDKSGIGKIDVANFRRIAQVSSLQVDENLIQEFTSEDGKVDYTEVGTRLTMQ